MKLATRLLIRSLLFIVAILAISGLTWGCAESSAQSLSLSVLLIF
ncbi:unnamed protein product [marine sediment metagenome]|uniref:Uncharacterized protein n=1 Tax=marine sediment metagenome TaxID=412755 RepID=X1TB94_9ZZZZ